MIKDITIGQYFPGKSFFHKMDARMKIVLTIAYIVLIFLCRNFYTLAGIVVFVAAMVAVSRIPFKTVLKSIRPLVIIILFTAVLNMLYVDGPPVIDFWIIHISMKGILTAVFMSVRIICLIVLSSLLTYTTSPSSLTDAIESLLKPLKYIKVDVHSIAMMMTIALRFIPTLVEEIDKIMSAQKARGAQLDNGNVFQRVKAMVPILIPLFVSSFTRASELADAMECRCYHGGEGRTSLRQMKVGGRDFAALAACVFMFAGVIVLNLKVPSVI